MLGEGYRKSADPALSAQGQKLPRDALLHFMASGSRSKLIDVVNVLDWFLDI